MSFRIAGRSILGNPGNRGQRVRRLARAVAWQISKRCFPRPRIIRLANGRLFKAYPDCIVSSSLIYADWPEYHELRFLRSRIRPGDVLIDAGANVGHISLLLSDLVGGHAGIFAFEPAPGAFRRLCENWRLNGWPVDQLFEFALGSHAGSVFLDKRDDPLTTIGVWPERSDLNPFEVRMIRLDDMSAVWATRRVGVLKVDVEASEPEVLQGAHRLLKEHRVRTVMFESMEKGLDPAIAALLEDCGYCVFGLTGEGEPDFSRMDAQNLFAVPNESRGDLHT